jgi:MYXO-CTERM domain-containing protein
VDACLDDMDEDWTKPEECTRACGCASGGANGIAGLASALAAMALVTRRRRV